MRVASDLLTNYQQVISNLSLKGGGSGIFDVVVNGELIYSKHETGRHDEPGEVLALFTDKVGPTVPRYGA